MRFDVLTLFPNMFNGPLQESILKKAQEKGIIEIYIHNLRDFTHDKHRTADDVPYGGGPGMVMKPEPIFEAVESLLEKGRKRARVILLSPQGEKFTQRMAEELGREKHLILICGHYEGVDERVREYLVTDEISIGDYVLTGGELPAMVVIDAVSRTMPGVLGKRESGSKDSFTLPFLDWPHYTRPGDYRGMKVPSVLTSGDHEKIEKWRRKEALKRTLSRRPDLLQDTGLSNGDKKLLEEIEREKEQGNESSGDN